MPPTEIVMPPPPGGSAIVSRIDAAHRIPPTHLTTAPPPPRSVRLDLASPCEQPRKRSQMRWPLYMRLVGEIADAGVRELGLGFVGEPFACDWLADALEYAKARGIGFVSVATDGLHATPERVKRCLEAGLDALRFSVNEDAIGNVKSARRARDAGGHACVIYAASIRCEGEQQARMEKLTREVLPFVDEHYWLAACGCVPCWSLFNEAHITFDGRLSACGFDADEQWIMADLAESSFEDGWVGHRFARLRDGHLKGDVKGTLCQACLRYR